MKKLITLFACACAMFIAGCGKGPDAVALDFFKTMQAGKADEAYLKETCTEETAKLFGAVLALGKDEMMKDLKDVTFAVSDTKIDGDNATVTLKVTKKKDGKDESKDETVKLKKVDGKWKINQGKEDKKPKAEKKEPKKS